MVLSRSGRLMYPPEGLGALQEVIWADRSGRMEPVEPGWTVQPLPNGGVELSPDEQSIAIGIAAPGGAEVWVKQLSGPFTRLAFEGTSSRPAWSVDGRSVMFVSDVGGNRDLIMRRADGSGQREVVLDVEAPLLDGRWSPDGTWVVIRTPAPRDVLGFRPGVDSIPVALLESEFDETAPIVSPDGRFLAYVSDESGRWEVYVRPFPNVNDARTLVSTDGGREPRWAHSGQELFYKNAGGQLVAVAVTTDDGFQVTARTPLFTLPPGSSFYPHRATYDVTRDDQRFLMIRAKGATDDRPIGQYVVVENFLGELRQRMGSN